MIKSDIKLDIRKSPLQYYADSGGQVAPVMLSFAESAVIENVRHVEYGEFHVSVNKHIVGRMMPDFGLVPEFAGKIPVLLDWREMNVIRQLRRLEYGELHISVAKRNIMKVKPTASYVPNVAEALELLQGEELIFNQQGYETSRASK